MKPLRFLLILSVLAASVPALLATCHHTPEHHAAPGQIVRAQDYNAYYVWPGVKPPAGSHPAMLYLLDGEVRRIQPAGSACFTRLLPGVPHLKPDDTGKKPGLWMVVRLDRLDWNAGCYDAILTDLARWQAAGNDLQGLQLDFDAATHGLSHYAAFLADMRARLPRRWHLSITGLMDWSAHGDPQVLAGLKHHVDEVVIQTYQSRATIPGYGAYFQRMAGFPIPFRVALAQGGLWQAPAMLARQPYFKGYVVFLIRAVSRQVESPADSETAANKGK